MQIRESSRLFLVRNNCVLHGKVHDCVATAALTHYSERLLCDVKLNIISCIWRLPPASTGQQEVRCSGAALYTASAPQTYKALLVLLAEAAAGSSLMWATVFVVSLPTLFCRYVFDDFSIVAVPLADDMLSKRANKALAGSDDSHSISVLNAPRLVPSAKQMPDGV
ncbi:hypothetical protein Efla_006550 [Eimeria flavescens]